MLIKICGITSQENASHCETEGADFLGFIFYPKSKRYITAETAANIITTKIKRVGVFGPNILANDVLKIIKTAKLDMVQLHGGQDKKFCSQLNKDIIIKVIWPQKYNNLNAMLKEMEDFAPLVKYFLLDAGKYGGGHGKTINFKKLKNIKIPKNWFLAGGLNADNIKNIGKIDNLIAFDFNSGLEKKAGEKNINLIKKAINNVKILYNDLKNGDNNMNKGYFGQFGGQFVPELLIPPLKELEKAMETYLEDENFKNELNDLLINFAGRKTPLTYCPTISKKLGINLYLKREDLLHTGAHKVNNTLGQALLAKKMGKKNLIAETGAGQHGVATAVAAAHLGLRATVFMGAIDVKRQKANVERMNLLGTEVIPIKDGTQTLKDAINETLRYWISNQEDSHYCFGTAAGPHPFPNLVRHFQSIISLEAKEQFLERTNNLPDYVVACVGGGSNAIGMFHNFIKHNEVKIIGVEAGGTGEPGCYNSAPINLGRPGILHGQISMLLQDENGQVLPSHSISAGLDYPGVGPEHSYLNSIGRVKYNIINDNDALEAFHILSKEEGIIPALESSHALAWVLKNHATMKNKNILICLSGRGDKDMDIIREVTKKKDKK